MSQYSYCCDAKINFGICSMCGEHADSEDEEPLEFEDNTPPVWIDYEEDGIKKSKQVHNKKGAANP